MDVIVGTIEDRTIDQVGLTAQLVAAYVTCNRVAASSLPELITEMHAAISGLAGADRATPCVVNHTTSAQIRASITPERLISFENGKPYKILKRHLRACGLSPEAYRRKWGLPNDYPMTAPSYSARRSALARSFGLGQLPARAAAVSKA